MALVSLVDARFFPCLVLMKLTQREPGFCQNFAASRDVWMEYKDFQGGRGIDRGAEGKDTLSCAIELPILKKAKKCCSVVPHVSIGMG